MRPARARHRTLAGLLAACVALAHVHACLGADTAEKAPSGTPVEAPRPEAAPAPAGGLAEEQPGEMRPEGRPAPQTAGDEYPDRGTPMPADATVIPSPGAGSTELALSAQVILGATYEFSDAISPQAGVGVGLRWGDREGWSLSGELRLDQYRMRYYGARWDAPPSSTTGPGVPSRSISLFAPKDVSERRTTSSAFLERSHGMLEGGVFRVGLLRQELDNAFASMTLYGPAAGASAKFTFATYKFELSGEYARDRWGKRGRQDPDFVVLDGYETVSMFGVLKSYGVWRAVLDGPGDWGRRVSFGYEGSVTSFQYVDRYAHALLVQVRL